jgi:NOL1/NOP2/fmu family ribosome biogenesis protein
MVKFLNQKEISNLLNSFISIYGENSINIDELNSFNFYINEKGKCHISKINIENQDLDLERLSTLGLYFGSFTDVGDFRLSIEGSSFIKPEKNFLLLKEDRLDKYLSGENMSFEDFDKEESSIEKSPFYIVIYDYNGNKINLGVVSIKEETIFNFVPKSRRVQKDKLF